MSRKRASQLFWRGLCGLALLGLLAAAPGAGVSPAAAGTNLLVNPGFEGPYSTWGGIREFQVSQGWTPWYANPAPPGFDPATYRRPEYKNAAGFANRVHSGCCAQQYFNTYSTHQAGLYQQVPVNKGASLRFSAYAQVWSSSKDDPTVSTSSGLVTVRVGIDPSGGTNPAAAGVIWSAPVESYDRWSLLSVGATASASTVTVFVYSSVRWAVKHNDVYWDDASLEAVAGGVTPTATPQPGASPATYMVQPGDTLNRIAARYGTTWQTLASLNGLSDPNRIYVGQVLKLPGGAPAPAPTPGAPPAGGRAALYAVRKGDTLARLAARFGASLARRADRRQQAE
ncbi:MAG: LysM peptidoglycan-binding domain-containing protein [Chloroflexi bacterium]|nr:LysM peptidoglycan-binding domain-containing protein [Chloroflexota bacterium]